MNYLRLVLRPRVARYAKSPDARMAVDSLAALLLLSAVSHYLCLLGLKSVTINCHMTALTPFNFGF